MENIRIYTTIKLEGMEKLKELLKKQEELSMELEKNAGEIEHTVRAININLSIEKATSNE